MSPERLSEIQDGLGLSDDEMGAALGLTGKSRARSVRRFKTLAVPANIAVRAEELAKTRKKPPAN